MYKCIHFSAPQYLIDKFIVSRPLLNTRGNTNNNLSVPLYRKTFGQRTFNFLGSKLWNAIPLDIRQASSLDNFKYNYRTNLSTNLYNIPFYLDS